VTGDEHAHHHDDQPRYSTTQVCRVQLPTSAANVALSAFVAQRRRLLQQLAAAACGGRMLG